MIDVTNRAKLVAYKEQDNYIVYVFENLEIPEYFMCTRFPNWECPNINIGEIGYVNFRIIIGGVDVWYDTKTNTPHIYNYSGNHFINFVKEKQKVDKIIIS